MVPEEQDYNVRPDIEQTEGKKNMSSQVRVHRREFSTAATSQIQENPSLCECCAFFDVFYLCAITLQGLDAGLIC